MPKVVTGSGLQEFISSGKHETIAAQKPSTEAAPLEVKKDAPVVDLGESQTVEIGTGDKGYVEPEIKNDGLEPEDQDLSEAIRKKIGKKHRAMKEAQEAAADAEAFAKGQYDRARLAEERATQLAKELEETRKVAKPPEPELQEPDIKSFTEDNGQVRWTDYTKAVADHAAKKAVLDDRVRQAQERDAADRAETAKKFKEKADKIDGFQDKMASTSVWFPNAVLEYITESDEGPQIAVFLADNPETAERISKLRPIKAIAEIGKLVKDFGKPAEPAKPPAASIPVERGGAPPPPITPVSGAGSGTVNTDPSRMSFRELRDYERTKAKKR